MIRFIIGSKNDQPHLAVAEDIFNSLGVVYKVHVYSCHRNAKQLLNFLDTVRSGKNKTDLIIAVANSVANLPAIIARYIKDAAIPVIGVGLSGKRLGGADSLLAIATIPKRVPLLNTGIDEVGMYNAALASLNLLAMKDKSLAKKIKIFYNQLEK